MREFVHDGSTHVLIRALIEVFGDEHNRPLLQSLVVGFVQPRTGKNGVDVRWNRAPDHFPVSVTVPFCRQLEPGALGKLAVAFGQRGEVIVTAHRDDLDRINSGTQRRMPSSVRGRFHTVTLLGLRDVECRQVSRLDYRQAPSAGSSLTARERARVQACSRSRSD